MQVCLASEIESMYGHIVCNGCAFNYHFDWGGSPQHAYYIRNSSVYHSSFPLLSQVPRRRSLLPSHLHSVMGSANLRLARGDIPAAIELCMEVVRQGTYLCMRKKSPQTVAQLGMCAFYS